MGSTQVGIVRDLATYPPPDPIARKNLYNAALELLYHTESAQDTAQRLYHGVNASHSLRGLHLQKTDYL